METDYSQSTPQVVNIPFDKYIYKNIVDKCSEFSDLYSRQVPGRSGISISWELARKFHVLLDFCRSCESLPEYYRKPPLRNWNVSENPNRLIIHPRRANQFVMKLMNEIKRQQAEHTLTEAEFKEMMGDEYLE